MGERGQDSFSGWQEVGAPHVDQGRRKAWQPCGRADLALGVEESGVWGGERAQRSGFFFGTVGEIREEDSYYALWSLKVELTKRKENFFEVIGLDPYRLLYVP